MPKRARTTSEDPTMLTEEHALLLRTHSADALEQQLCEWVRSTHVPPGRSYDRDVKRAQTPVDVTYELRKSGETMLAWKAPSTIGGVRLARNMSRLSAVLQAARAPEPTLSTAGQNVDQADDSPGDDETLMLIANMSVRLTVDNLTHVCSLPMRWQDLFDAKYDGSSPSESEPSPLDVDLVDWNRTPGNHTFADLLECTADHSLEIVCSICIVRHGSPGGVAIRSGVETALCADLSSVLRSADLAVYGPSGYAERSAEMAMWRMLRSAVGGARERFAAAIKQLYGMVPYALGTDAIEIGAQIEDLAGPIDWIDDHDADQPSRRFYDSHGVLWCLRCGSVGTSSIRRAGVALRLMQLAHAIYSRRLHAHCAATLKAQREEHQPVPDVVVVQVDAELEALRAYIDECAVDVRAMNTEDHEDSLIRKARDAMEDYEPASTKVARIRQVIGELVAPIPQFTSVAHTILEALGGLGEGVERRTHSRRR